MNGLILASYIIKTQHQKQARDIDYVGIHKQAQADTRRALVSLGVTFASLSGHSWLHSTSSGDTWGAHLTGVRLAGCPDPSDYSIVSKRISRHRRGAAGRQGLRQGRRSP